MISSKTYICGDVGSIGRLDDLVGPIINVSLAPGGIVNGNLYLLLDIETDPLNADKVFVVGEGRCMQPANPASNFYGIGVSSNAGVSWSVPGGNYQTIPTPSFCYHKWNEVCVVNSNTIYVCGIREPATNKGTVVKSTDGGLTFNRCNPLPSIVDGMDCTSIHFITDLIGVVGLNDYIVKTIDGGATWIVLNGGITFTSTGDPCGAFKAIHMSTDEDNIVAVCPSRIIKTLQVPPGPGGIAMGSWSTVMPLNNDSGHHLTAYDDNTMVMSGLFNTIMRTDDAGNTWTSSNPLPPTTFNSPNRLAAHYYKKTLTTLEGFFSGGMNLYNTTDGEVIIPLPALTATFNMIIQSVWTWYTESADPTCYLLSDCESEDTILTSTDLSTYVGGVIKILGHNACYIVSIAEDCAGAVPVIPSSQYATCQECNPTCYLLTDCNGLLPSILVNTDLSAQVGSVVKINSHDDCWLVSEAPGCDGSVGVTINLVYDTCQDCHPVCYKLVDCNNNGNILVTSTNFFQYVGKIIKLQDYGNVCWVVEDSITCEGSIPLSNVTEVFDTCEECLPPPPEIPEKSLNSRRVKPGYYTKGCAPEYTERISCSFSEQVYKDVISLRYGITSCCEEDTDKWDVKKQILDFKGIYDPDMCQSVCHCNCPCPTDIVVLLEQFYPIIECGAPSGVIVSIEIPPIICPHPENLVVGISI